MHKNKRPAHRKSKSLLHALRLCCLAVILIGVIGIIVLDMTGWSLRHAKPQTAAQTMRTALPKGLTYGIAIGDPLTSTSHKARMTMLKAIRTAGFSEVRLDLDWSSIQAGGPKSYNWKATDAVMKDIRTSGLRALLTLDRTPTWARLSGCTDNFFCPPAQPATFAQFAASAARRYKSYPIDAWEIWNEPNINNFWKPDPSAQAYSALLQSAYTAIKVVTPHTPVLVGGIAGNALDSNGVGYIDPRTYLSELYAAGDKNYFDGIAYHPYTGLRLPSTPATYNGWQKMADTNPSMRSIMTDNHDQSKGIWITEFGLPTDGSGLVAQDLNAVTQTKGADHVTQDQQATVAQAALQAIPNEPWIKTFDWYTYSDNKLDPDSSAGSFGLVSANGAPKPAYYIFKNSLR